MIKAEDLRIRDPFIVNENGVYYLTGTDFTPNTINIYKSDDLKTFSPPIAIFHAPENCSVDVREDFWAPEIHAYNGKYLLLVSPVFRSGRRGTVIAVSDTIDGEYTLLKDGPATPESQSCIDGTLYVEEGTPYIVYSHDWPDCPAGHENGADVYEGEICAVKLNRDLSDSGEKPFRILGGAEPDFAVANAVPPLDWLPRGGIRYGTDGPFLYKTTEGALIMLWSPMVGNNYVIAAACSESGSITGRWRHSPAFVYDKNGGHTMIFTDKENRLRLCFHAPEKHNMERMTAKILRDTGRFIAVEE